MAIELDRSCGRKGVGAERHLHKSSMPCGALSRFENDLALERLDPFDRSGLIGVRLDRADPKTHQQAA